MHNFFNNFHFSPPLTIRSVPNHGHVQYLTSQSMQADSIDSGELLKCKHCRGLTLEKLAEPKGYLHAPSRSSLVRSAQRCRLCSLLFRKDRSRHNSQLRLSIEPFSDEDPQICLKISHLNNTTADGTQLAFFLYTPLGISCHIYVF
jgi:hypothetical protein